MRRKWEDEVCTTVYRMQHMTEYTKHTTHTDALDTLGTIIGPDEKRDAIHLAVFPAQAASPLTVGAHVRLTDDGRATPTKIGQGVGIVDPFLQGSVKTGEWFWLVVYPRQITSLRHVWEHPAFETTDKATSEMWLRDFHANLDTYVSFEMLTERALADPNDMSFEDEIYGEIPSEFWLHLSIWSGRTIPSERAGFFGCGC